MNEVVSAPDKRTIRWRRMAYRATFKFVSGKARRTRRAFYEWLADQMGIPVEQAKIRTMDIEQCKAVIKICKEAKRHG